MFLYVFYVGFWFWWVLVSNVFEAKEKLLQQLGWSENPFVKDLRVFDKDSFKKYYCPFEAQDIVERLAFDAKACLLLGPKGVGKTSALTFVAYSLPEKEFSSVMFKEPPATLSALLKEAGLSPSSGFLGGFLPFLRKKHKEPSRAKVAEAFKSLEKKVVLFVDEAHLEQNKGMYMEFKYLLDEVPNLRIVFSALSKEPFPDSLLQLIGEKNVFSRNGFSAQEMLRIIEHRIAAVGGKGTEPFDAEFLEGVLTEQNLLTPRYVFDELNNRLAQIATGKVAPATPKEEPYAEDAIIASAIARSKQMAEEASGAAGAQEKITTAHADWWVMLSPSQQAVMELLVRKDTGMTLHEIMTALSMQQNTAFNALYQLRGDDEAERKRKPEVPFPLVEVKQKLVGGRKRNIYFVNQKIKQLFTLH